MRPPLIPQSVPINDHEAKHIKIMKSCFNHLVEYREPKSNRILVSPFMCLPSRKDFSSYFDIIKRPISMYEIRKRIDQNVYKLEDDCIDDFKLMFNNCRYFNEDDSQIFKDAVKLEDMLLKKYQQLKRENGGTNGESSRHIANSNNIHHNNHHNNNTTNNINNQHQQHHQQQHPIPNHNGLPSSELDSNSNSNISCSQEDILLFNNNDSISSSIASPSSEIVVKPRRPKRDRDAPKKRLLTGYIIYAAEVRKEYVDKHPNSDFGFISRLIGNDWKALSSDLKHTYEQRANAHNIKQLKEKSLRESMMATQDADSNTESPMTNGTRTPKMTKKRLAKLAREQAKANKTSTPYHPDHHDSPFRSSLRHHDGRSSHMVSQATANSSFRSSEHQGGSRYSYSLQQNIGQQTYNGKPMTTESATQTAPLRFVEPPTRRRFAYYENFRRYIEDLDVANKDLLAEETSVPMTERPSDSATQWLGGGIGRYESPEAALWGLRDFMLQDSETMRWNMQPYLCYAKQ